MRAPLGDRGAPLGDFGVGMGAALGGKPRRARIDALGNGRFPSAGATLDLDFVGRQAYAYGIGTAAPEELFAISGSGGTRINEAGLLVAANAPRYDYDPISLACKGALIEEQRTNLIIRSSEFDNAAWTKTNSTVSANVTVAPDGTLTADALIPNNLATNGIVSQQVTVLSSTVYVFDFYGKPNGQNTVSFVTNLTGSFIRNTFDVSAGTVAFSGAGFTNFIVPAGNGWYRCISLCTSGASVTSAPFQLGNNSIWTGDGVTGVYVWGAGLQQGSYATSSIPTAGSQITRTADKWTMLGIDSWFNQAQGTFLVEINDVNYSAASGNLFIQVDNGLTSGNRFLLYLLSGTPSPRFYVEPGGATVSFPNISQPVGRHQIAGSYDGASMNASFDGALGTQAAYTPPAVLTRLGLGSIGGSVPLNGHMRRLRYWPKRLPNERLQAMTR